MANTKVTGDLVPNAVWTQEIVDAYNASIQENI